MEERWEAGRQVGDYLLRELLGAGAGGRVFRAERADGGGECALKVLRRGASLLDRERFERERRVLELLGDHPGVTRLLHAGSIAERPFLAVELCPGGSLEERLADGPLPPREAAERIAQVADAVAHLHAAGLLHRDLKPANVLFGADGRPRLADFGLARPGEVDEEGRLTDTGAMVGTVHYASPEQVEGRRELDERTDVYGLGAVLFHALSGRPPFEGPQNARLLVAVMRDDPPALRSLRPEVPAALERLCLGCLDKEPARRPASAVELARALRGGGGGLRAWIAGLLRGR